MKTQFLNFSLAWVLLFIIAGFVNSSCNKKPESIGLDLVDDNKPFVGYDTSFALYAYSEVEDSVPADETSYNLFGSLYSKTFGLTNAGFYTHLRLGSLNPDFGPNAVADSVFFTMVYAGYYGNIETEQTMRIYRVNDVMIRDSSYWSNKEFEIYPDVELANFTFTPHPNDSVEVDSNTILAARLKVPMSLDFAQEILDIDNDSIFESSSAFIEYFNGIYVKPDPVTSFGGGSILSFDLTSGYSEVIIYYHNDTTTSEDTLTYSLTINSNNARINRFEHDYTKSWDDIFRKQILFNDTSYGNQKLYLQGMAGVRTVIKFPDISSWIDSGNVVINEAKLIISGFDFEEGSEPPTKLLLFKILGDGLFDFTPDQATQGEVYFGGGLVESSNSYTFRISLYLQDLLAGEEDLGLGLYPTAKSIKANELIFKGAGIDDPGRFRLNIIYSKTN
ncbi:MAG: DUF4270 domain-containing protein [Bacteroidales bacterium]|nr:DUF4270 domain-containing protein [Bacteroidales bacterium]MCF8403707.1 DUF4270 domain-containing protein [Bacteroidales bacterium]